MPNRTGAPGGTQRQANHLAFQLISPLPKATLILAQACLNDGVTPYHPPPAGPNVMPAWRVVCVRRLSWHLDNSLGGYRAGATTSLNEDSTWRKVIYQVPTYCSYLPDDLTWDRTLCGLCMHACMLACPCVCASAWRVVYGPLLDAALTLYRWRALRCPLVPPLFCSPPSLRDGRYTPPLCRRPSLCDPCTSRHRCVHVCRVRTWFGL